MMTIRTTGDDAHDTDARLVNALVGYHVTLAGRAAHDLGISGEAVEVVGSDEGGNLTFRFVHKGSAYGVCARVPLHNLTITVL